MKISVLGTGGVGRTIASKLQSKGHDVFMGTRDSKERLARDDEKFKAWKEDHKSIELVTFKEAAEKSEMIINCTGGLVSLSVLKQIGPNAMNGKVLLDLANPLDFSSGFPPSLNPVNTTSLAEQIQDAFPDVRVVKSLNTMNAEVMLNPRLLSGSHNVFMSGNEEEAKEQVRNLLESFGWEEHEVVDMGDITTARGAEMILPIWLRLYGTFKTTNFNFHIQVN